MVDGPSPAFHLGSNNWKLRLSQSSALADIIVRDRLFNHSFEAQNPAIQRFQLLGALRQAKLYKGCSDQ